MTNAFPHPHLPLLHAAADELHRLAKCLDGCGYGPAARHLSAAASEIDIALPTPSGWWSEPFNGQRGRAQLFLDLIERVRPAAIFETGTFRGTTTAYIAKHFVGPIFTCEADLRWFVTARARLAEFAQVHVRHGDSRPFLAAVLAEAPPGPILAYLDAHLLDIDLFVDLPLRTELETILASGRSAVVLVDDFEVSGDAGYEFVDAGPGRRMDATLLAGLDDCGAALFFPTLRSAEETGYRRGCAVIAAGDAIEPLASMPDLRRHSIPAGPPSHEPASTALSPPDVSAIRDLVEARRYAVEREAVLDQAAVAQEEAQRLSLERDDALRQAAVAQEEAQRSSLERDNALRQAAVAQEEAQRSSLERDNALRQAAVAQEEAQRSSLERDNALRQAAVAQEEAQRSSLERDNALRQAAVAQEEAQRSSLERDNALRQAAVAQEEAQRSSLERDNALRQAAVAQEEAQRSSLERDNALRQAAVAQEEAQRSSLERDNALGRTEFAESAFARAEIARHGAILRAEGAEAEARSQAELARKTAEAFRTSTSWKVTAPVRLLGRWFGR